MTHFTILTALVAALTRYVHIRAEAIAEAIAEAVSNSRIFWLKDNKLVISPLTREELRAAGIEYPALDNPPGTNHFKASKRISRVLRPTRYARHLSGRRTRIEIDPALDPAIHDGIAYISRELLALIAETATDAETLLNATRWEITALIPEGQIKGHAVIDPHATAHIRIARDQIKPEVAQVDGRVYVALDPVHGKDAAAIDIQSLINFHSFLPLPILLEETAARFSRKLDAVTNGQRLGLDEDSNFVLAQWVTRGGKATDAPALYRMATGLVIKQAERYARDTRSYVPGLMRRYLASDLHGRGIEEGHAYTDATSLYVSDADYPRIAASLGGADQDDALLVLPFIDYTGTERALIWRNPNQPGEYELVTLDNPPGDTWLRADSRQLIAHISTQPKYRTVPTGTPARSWYDAARRAAANYGAIGAFANWLMIWTANEGTPAPLPCSFESIIDATVKDGRDISRELRTISQWMDIYTQGDSTRAPHPIPATLAPRARNAAKIARDHWLDRYRDALHAIAQDIAGRATAEAYRIAIPLAILEHANAETGSRYNRRYAAVVREYTEADIAQQIAHMKAMEAGESPEPLPDTDSPHKRAAALMAEAIAKLAPEPQTATICGMIADALATGRSDAHIFSGEMAAATNLYNVMAHIGVFNPDAPRAKSAQVLHVWFNGHPQHATIKMSDIPAEERRTRKAQVIARTPTQVQVTGRQVTTPQGDLLGLLPKDATTPEGTYTVANALADTNEGSLTLLLH